MRLDPVVTNSSQSDSEPDLPPLELEPELADGPSAAEHDPDTRPPSLGWLLLEGRAVGELLTTYAVMPWLKRGPEGDGHPVLVLPGFLATDVSTGPLRRFLKKRGYDAHPWKMGRNYGPRKGVEGRLMERLKELRERYERRVSLIGWSLGGVYARLLANRSPQDVRCVITLGTPFNSNPKANRSWKLFEWVSGSRIDEVDEETFAQIRNTPPVPTTSIYSVTDGVVNWRCSVDPQGPEAENIQVSGSHIGLGANPLVLHAILDRLAQPPDEWQPFERSGLKRVLYRRPRNPEKPASADDPAEAELPSPADVQPSEA